MNVCHVNDECCGLLTKCECGLCAQPVCRSCSIRMLDYHVVHVVRFCHRCIREAGGPETELIVAAHVQWLKDAPRSRDQMDRYHPFNKPSFSFDDCRHEM